MIDISPDAGERAFGSGSGNKTTPACILLFELERLWSRAQHSLMEHAMRLSTVTGFVLLTACGLGLGGLSVADDAKPPPATDDTKLIEGDWNVVALEADGKKAPTAELKGMRWSFKNAELQCTDPGEKASDKSSVKLD